MSKQTQRIYPTHANEALFFWSMRSESVVLAVQDLCRDYYAMTSKLPNAIFINTKLLDKFEQEMIDGCGKIKLCVNTEDIVWFYSDPKNMHILSDQQFIVVANSELPRISCCL